MTEKKIEIVFAPGCFDDFEGTQVELDDLVKEIRSMVDSGQLFEESKPIDDLIDEMSDEEFEELAKVLVSMDTPDPSRLQ